MLCVWCFLDAYIWYLSCPFIQQLSKKFNFSDSEWFLFDILDWVMGSNGLIGKCLHEFYIFAFVFLLSFLASLYECFLFRFISICYSIIRFVFARVQRKGGHSAGVRRTRFNRFGKAGSKHTRPWHHKVTPPSMSFACLSNIFHVSNVIYILFTLIFFSRLTSKASTKASSRLN